jgi:uncharacterized membrane protein
MSVAVFGLVLIAAVTHALWNFVAKRESGNLSLLWIGNGLAALCGLPFAAYIAFSTGLDMAAAPYLLATSVIHVFYFIYLTKSYRQSDISMVYPITRGIGVAGTALLGSVLLGESVSAMGLIGIGAVCGGVLLIGLAKKGHRLDRRTALYCLITGGAIIVYSIADKVGANILAPVIYIFLQFVLFTLFLAPYVWRTARETAIATWRKKKLISLTVGVCAMGTYLLILFAFRLGQVSYIVPLRESSVLIGALLGVVFLKERLTAAKGLGIVLILVGLVAIKFA